MTGGDRQPAQRRQHRADIRHGPGKAGVQALRQNGLRLLEVARTFGGQCPGQEHLAHGLAPGNVADRNAVDGSQMVFEGIGVVAVAGYQGGQAVRNDHVEPGARSSIGHLKLGQGVVPLTRVSRRPTCSTWSSSSSRNATCASTASKRLPARVVGYLGERPTQQLSVTCGAR